MSEHAIRERIERLEQETLSPYAARAADSRGREVPEPQDPVRTVFQRDRDRILHSKPFRRLKHKTQVFIDPFGDHYRTRLTHTLEVAQIARTIGRALRLNEDLIEAIALGHDVGHTPFGHVGEAALDEAIREWHAAGGRGEPSGFRHHEQSLHIVRVLPGMNLTYETLEGIGGHSKGDRDLSSFDGEPVSTLEAAVVRISDRVAYLNHDLDDALRSGMAEAIPERFQALGPTHAKRIGRMVRDIIEQSEGRRAIRISEPLLELMNELKDWLFENVYRRYPHISDDTQKAHCLVKELFFYYMEADRLPQGYEGLRGAVDYVSGMTDRFAIRHYAELKLPDAFRVP